MGDVVDLFSDDGEPAFVIQHADISGQLDLFASWAKGAAGIAQALGIRVVLSPRDEAYFNIECESVEDPITMKALKTRHETKDPA